VGLSRIGAAAAAGGHAGAAAHPSRGASGRNLRRIAAAIRLATGAGLLLAGLGRGEPLVAVPLAVVGVVLGLPALRAVLPPGTLRAAPGLPAAVATMGLLNLAFFGVDAFVPLALVDVRGRSVAFAGLALTAATITWTTGSWLQARLVARSDRRVLVRVGLALVVGGELGTALVLWPAVPVAVGLVAWSVAGLGIGLAYSTATLVVLQTAPRGEEGAASSSLQLANTLGAGLGAGLGGALVGLLGAEGESLRGPLLGQDLAMVGVLVVALAIAGRLPAKSPVAAEDAR
jgi:MFS family permease